MHARETDRLILRNFKAEDAAALFAYLHQPTASCFFSLKLDDMDAARREAARRSTGDDYIAVCLKQDGALIGDLFAVSEDDDDTLSIGWNFNPHFAGQGYASEAARALVHYLFTDRKARRLYAYVEDHNLPSQKICERLGMRREGLFKEFVTFTTDATGAPIYENTLQYAILKKEWDQGEPE